MSVTKQIELIAEDICDNYCKYRETCDENAESEIIRAGGSCPLNKLIRGGNMSRLIRDTDLMQDLAECTMVAIDRSGTGMKWEDYIKLDDVVRVIKSQPTAYSVEAVVRELEESLEKAEHKADEYDSGTWDDIAIGLCEAIEIVKRGGRNE